MRLMSHIGASRTSGDVRFESAKWAKADPRSRPGFTGRMAGAGTAAPYGTGSVRYRDSRSRTTFTTTTMNGVTRFYDSGGHLTATVIGSRRR